MNRLRGAIVGCGFVSEFHLRGWARIPEVEISAFVDPVESRARDRRAKFAPQARTYARMEDLLDAEALDFVDILTPPWLHRRQCMLAAKAGLHIVCQKPLCDRLDDAQRLVEDLRGYRRHFVVHENHRYRPWFQDVLRRVRKGELGSVRYVELVQHDPTEPTEKIDTEVERGVMLQYGVHLVDMVHALLGDPLRICARMQRINPRVRGESLAHAVLDYPEATAVVAVSWKPGGMPQGGALIVCEQGEACFEGRLTRGDEGRFRLRADGVVICDERRSPTMDYLESFYQLERAFVDSILHGQPPPQPASENLGSLVSTFATYEAARAGGPVAFATLAHPHCEKPERP